MNPNLVSANKTYNITQNGTTILPGKLILVGLIINTKGASSNVISIYDSNATLGASASLKKGQIDTTIAPIFIPCGYPMFNGIYIASATGTAADITVVYADAA